MFCIVVTKYCDSDYSISVCYSLQCFNFLYMEMFCAQVYCWSLHEDAAVLRWYGRADVIFEVWI